MAVLTVAQRVGRKAYMWAVSMAGKMVDLSADLTVAQMATK